MDQEREDSSNTTTLPTGVQPASHEPATESNVIPSPVLKERQPHLPDSTKEATPTSAMELLTLT